MAEANEIKFDIGLSITEESALLALKLVELYLSGNVGKRLAMVTISDGTQALNIVDRNQPTEGMGTCVICGEIIPEGKFVCTKCENRRSL
jgi:hypothetical protein